MTDRAPLANSSPRASVSAGANRRNCRLVLGLLGVVYLSTVFAGFLAPNDPATQNRDFSFAPPTRLHFVDGTGRLHLRPFVYGLAGARDSGDTRRIQAASIPCASSCEAPRIEWRASSAGTCICLEPTVPGTSF